MTLMACHPFMREALLVWCIFMLPAFAYAQDEVMKNGPDEAVTEFRLNDLRADLLQMKDGPEKDYFAGILASRLNHFPESIEALSRALPSLRESRPKKDHRQPLPLRTLSLRYNHIIRFDSSHGLRISLCFGWMELSRSTDMGGLPHSPFG